MNTIKIALPLTILLLILSKVLNIWHINLDSYYLDIDRLLALLTFLTFYWWKIDRLQWQASLFLLLGAILTVSLADWLGINPLKMTLLFFMTALVEEILLRGVVFHLMLKKLSPLQTLFLSTFLFTIVHPAIYSQPLYGVAVFITGLLLGGTYLVILNKHSQQMAISIATTLHALIILAGLTLGLI